MGGNGVVSHRRGPWGQQGEGVRARIRAAEKAPEGMTDRQTIRPLNSYVPAVSLLKRNPGIQ